MPDSEQGKNPEFSDSSEFATRLRKDLQALPRIQAPAGFEVSLRHAIHEQLSAPVYKVKPSKPGFFALFRAWPAYAQGAVAASVVIIASIVISQFAPRQMAVNAPPEPAQTDATKEFAYGRQSEAARETESPAKAPTTSPAATPTTAPRQKREEATSPEAPPDSPFESSSRRSLEVAKPAPMQDSFESVTRGNMNEQDTAPQRKNGAIDKRANPSATKKALRDEPNIIKADSTKSTIKWRKAKKDTTRSKPLGPKIP